MGDLLIGSTVGTGRTRVTFATTPRERTPFSFVDSHCFEDLEDVAIMDSAEAEADRDGWASWDDVKRELGL
jgi:hypothetical protein